MIKKLLVIFCFSSTIVCAQPTRPIKLIVGFAAGSSNDIVARQIAGDIANNGGPPIVIENRIGASGDVATAEIINTRDSDDPKLFLASSALYASTYTVKNNSFDIANQIQPVSFVGTTPMVLETGRESKIYNLADIAKSQKTLTYGTGGKNSLTYIGMAYLSNILATSMIDIPYQGSGRSLPDVASGRVDLCFDFYSSSRSFIQSGLLRPIAVTGNTRLPELPDVPTLKENGINWPLDSFFMLFASTNLDAATVAQIQNILNRAYVNNYQLYESKGIHPDPRKNKNIKQFHKDMVYHYQSLKISLNSN